MAELDVLAPNVGEVQAAALRNVPPSNRGFGLVHLPSTIHPDIGRKIPLLTGFTKHIHYEQPLHTRTVKSG